MSAMRDKIGALALGFLLFALSVAVYLPRPHRAPVPAPPAPYCDDVQPVAVSAAEPKASKACSPACKAKEVCVDGTCCQPAAAPHSPSSSTAIAIVADSLR